MFYGDACAGTIARRTSAPNDADGWEWGCGFYPGTELGEGSSGIGATFEAAPDGFDGGWRILLPTRTEADFQAWLDQRDRTSWKYAMGDAGMKIHTQGPDGGRVAFVA